MNKKSTNPDSQSAGLHSDVVGIVQGHRDGHGFVIADDGLTELYLGPQEMQAVMHRDRVRARVLRYDRKGRPEGRVVDILERPSARIIGRLLMENGGWIVAPEDKRYGQDVIIPKNATGKAEAGQVVVAELTEKPSLQAQPVGKVVEVLGGIDDPGMEIEIAVRKYDVPHRFSDATEAEAAKLPTQIRPADRKDRVDLTDVPLVTIDGEDARDFDDAVYCEPYAIGKGKKAETGWRLIVAIADVSHYVKPGSALDADAFERATSVYFPRRVIPMLPEKLSNGLCSLNPLQDRLSMVCDMIVSAQGEVQAYQFYPAVICSHARFTYTEVAAILGNTKGLEASRRKDLVPHLLALHDVYRALLKARVQRGAMDFDTTETQIVCDENGRIERIVPRVRNDAHRLIEEAMLAANVCTADFIAQSKHVGLYRVHEGPTPEKRVTLQNYLRAMGIGHTVSDDPTPKEFQVIANETKDRPEAPQIHMMLLRSMQQAIYTPINSGHFGLAYDAYTHFTSPIRRYPDLLVHRVIKAILSGKKYQVEIPKGVQPTQLTTKRGAPAKKTASATARTELKGQPAAESVWEIIGNHCSANERRADEASRDVEAWLKCIYMREHLGEEYAGTVSAATSFGLFVQLDDIHVEGLVHITELGGEYYRFDEARQELRGERTGIRYALGTRLMVQVSRVDLDGRKIDFRLVRDGQDTQASPSASKRRGAESRRSRVLPAEKNLTAAVQLAAVKAKDRQVKASRKGSARKAVKSAAKSTSGSRKRSR